MIQIYKSSNTDYEMNGDMVILPTKCEVDMTLNGNWEMTLEHPIDEEGRWEYIEEGNVVCAPTPMGEKQLFRIYSKIKNRTQVKAYARPVFFDSAHDVFLMDVRPTEKNGQQALDIMLGGSKYSATSNISVVNTAYYVNKNFMEALQGDDDNTFLNRWGGEILYDNYTAIINSRVGGDYGVKVEFGRNLKSIEEEIDMDNVITRIVPMSYNGYMLNWGGQCVDSPNIDKYPVIYTKLVQFEDVKLTEDCAEDEVGFDTLVELRTELIMRCARMFNAGCDTPSINYVIDMVDLSKTEEYKDYQILEMVMLGDTVHCKHRRLNIETTARVIRIKYDCILKKNIEEELGDTTYDYFKDTNDKVSSASDKAQSASDKAQSASDAALQAQNTANHAWDVADLTYENLGQILNDDGTVRGDVVKGVLNAMNTQLRYQKNITQKQDVRAILFEDTDPSSTTFGALALGTLGLQIADKRTVDGRDWDWTTAITAKGAVADIIVAGVMVADRIKGGTLTLGGNSNVNGNLKVLSSSGQDILNIDYRGLLLYTKWLSYATSGVYIDMRPDIFNGMSIHKNSDLTGEVLYMSNNVLALAADGSDALSSATAYLISNTASMGNDFVRINGDGWLDDYILMTPDGLVTTGSKNRAARTEDYNTRLLYCYEMSSPYFGDIGQGILDEDGCCYIFLDDVFAETVNTTCIYQVFLQQEGQGDIWVDSKESAFFIVKGTPGLSFSWEVKAKQDNYEFEHLEVQDTDWKFKDVDYSSEAAEMVKTYYEELEDVGNEEIN